MGSARKHSGPHMRHEQSCDGPVCGIDEAGRAPLAGPVTAACVYIPEGALKAKFWKKVRDSKQVPEPLREELFALIVEHAFYGIAEASREEIDTMNIHHASLLAMSRAYEAMVRNFSVVPVLALIDGKFVPKALPCEGRAIVGGDDVSRSIAAASILAKVTRDRLMRALHEQFPQFGWDRNAGYPTPEHIRAVRAHGPTPHHRRTFGVVKEIFQAGLALAG